MKRFANSFFNFQEEDSQQIDSEEHYLVDDDESS